MKNTHRILIKEVAKTAVGDWAYGNTRSYWNVYAVVPIDYDNDSWVDLCLVNRRDNYKTPWPWPHLFRNTGKATFVEVDHKPHGIGGGGGGRDLNYADLDADGRIDVVIHDGTGGGYDGADNSRVYANRIDNGNHWMRLHVVAGEPARTSVVARVMIYAPGTTTILGCDDVRTDFCYRSKRSPVLHFGLGSVQQVDITVVTRDGRRQRFEGLTADQIHTLIRNYCSSGPDSP